MENFKEQDCEKLIAFIVNKDQVLVSELIEECGADKLRIYPLLAQLAQEKRIRVLKESAWGAPEVVALN